MQRPRRWPQQPAASGGRRLVAVPADMCTCNLSLVFEGTSKHHPLMQIQESRRQLHTVGKRRVSRQRQWQVSRWQVGPRKVRLAKKRHQGGMRLILHRLSSFNFLLRSYELYKLVLHPRRLLAGWLPRSHIGGSPGQRQPMCSRRRTDPGCIPVRVGEQRRSGDAAGGAPKAAMC